MRVAVYARYRPTDTKQGYEVELIGELAAMLRFGMGGDAPSSATDRGLFLSSVKVVAGARFERAAFRL